MADWARTTEILRGAVESGAVPAVVAGVTGRDGIVYRGAFGTNGADGRAVEFDALFWIASMTKGLTSVAAMQLVEDGSLPLDAPLRAVLPELAQRPVLEGFDAAGQPILRPARTEMTLAHLLSHSSGFAENVWSEATARYVEITGTPTGGTARRAALDLPLMFDPGQAWQYGISHDWVSRAVEKASGLRFDAYLAERLLAPLGMRDTTYFPSAAQKERLVALQGRDADGRLSPVERNPPPESEREFISGGGTIHSTADDFLTFIRMILNRGEAEGGHVLGEETVAELSRNRTGTMPVSRLVSTLPHMSNSLELLPGIRKCWGAGFMVNLEPLPTGRRAGSLAWAGLGNTWYWIDPQSGLGGVLMTQILPFGDRAVLDLFEAFESAVYAALR